VPAQHTTPAYVGRSEKKARKPTERTVHHGLTFELGTFLIRHRRAAHSIVTFVHMQSPALVNWSLAQTRSAVVTCVGERSVYLRSHSNFGFCSRNTKMQAWKIPLLSSCTVTLQKLSTVFTAESPAALCDS
jgi:hypothetical protein